MPKEVIPMKTITASEITEAVARLCVEAATVLPADVRALIEKARKTETNAAAKGALDDISANYLCAEAESLPICQDTGMAVVFCSVGTDVHIDGDFEKAVNDGVRKGYTEGCLRKSVVRDPFDRVNAEDNTPAVIHTRLVPGDKLTITVAPKGFGSENKSAMKIFLPSAKPSDFTDFIAETVRKAGGDPCPPVIVGVGIGGTVDKCAENAKLALTLSMDSPNPDPFYEALECEALAKCNATRIGAQGFGGDNTALAVRIIPNATHIAGTPCVVNISCHATRHASATL